MADTPSEALPVTQPPRKRRKGGGAKFLFVVLIILALVGVIVYLLSMINSKRFFLVPEGDQLVVKKGVFFLAGSEPYKGADPGEASLYASIDLPDKFGTEQREFEDLAALNIEFANILISEAQRLVFAKNDVDYRQGQAYLDRLDKLKGLKPDQVKLIMALNADVDYIEAKRSYEGVERTLAAALKKFKQAETYGTGRFADAPEWIRKVEGLLLIIKATKNGTLPAPAKARPSTPPPEDEADAQPVDQMDEPPPEAITPEDEDAAPPAVTPRGQTRGI